MMYSASVASPMPPISGLAARLREATHHAHRHAERSAFLRTLMRGQIRQGSYLGYLVALWHVYHALDEGLARHVRHPVVGPFARPELARAAALTADLAHLSVHDPADAPVSPVALDYAARLRRLAVDDPALLIAHAYVRYLGDLSGGQLLRPAVARALGLAGPGLAFYAYPQIADLDACKREFRSDLDAIPETSASAIIGEALHAFDLNGSLLADLT